MIRVVINNIIVFAHIFIVLSCSPDKVFLQPTPLPLTQRCYKIPGNADSIVVLFRGNNYEPVFTKFGKDTVDMPFSVQAQFVTSTTGHNLHTWFLKHDSVPAHTTLIYMHGNSGNLATNYALMTPLLQHGYQIYMVDYSGFGYSQGEATRQHVLDDGLSFVDFVCSQPQVSQTKIILYGQSFGGHASTVVAHAKQAQLDGLVIEAAFSSHHDAMTGILGWLGRMVTPELFSAKDSIGLIRKPILIIHSNEDDIVPLYMGKRLYERAQQPKYLLEIGGCHVCGPQLYDTIISEAIRTNILHYTN